MKKGLSQQHGKKVRLFEGLDGWTHVLRGAKHAGPPSCTPNAARPIGEDVTLATLRSKHARIGRAWAEPGNHEAREGRLRAIVSDSEGLGVDRCICIGLGSLSQELHAQANTAMAQLVALESWLRVLASPDGANVPVFFQDPAFNDLDMEFLRSRGHTLIHAPDVAASYVTRKSLLFAPCCVFEAIGAAIGRERPALYIGNRIREYCHFHLEPSEDEDPRRRDELALLDGWVLASNEFRMPPSDVAAWLSNLEARVLRRGAGPTC